MTPPEKEFELKPGSYASWNGQQVLAIGPTINPKIWIIEVLNEYPSVQVSELTEWNPDPKPKSFEEEREAVAKEVEEYCPTCAERIRALQPDAPATAVVAEVRKELSKFLHLWVVLSKDGRIRQAYTHEPDEHRIKLAAIDGDSIVQYVPAMQWEIQPPTVDIATRVKPGEYVRATGANGYPYRLKLPELPL